MSIRDISEKIKGYVGSDQGHDLAIVGIIIVVGIVSFYLGRLSITDMTKDGISSAINHVQTTGVLAQTAGINLNSTQNLAIKQGTNSVMTSPKPQKEGSYVASVNGTKYYPVGCSTVNRIKEENKVYFNSTSEAENTGLTKSVTCDNY